MKENLQRLPQEEESGDNNVRDIELDPTRHTLKNQPAGPIKTSNVRSTGLDPVKKDLKIVTTSTRRHSMSPNVSPSSYTSPSKYMFGTAGTLYPNPLKTNIWSEKDKVHPPHDQNWVPEYGTRRSKQSQKSQKDLSSRLSALKNRYLRRRDEIALEQQLAREKKFRHQLSQYESDTSKDVYEDMSRFQKARNKVDYEGSLNSSSSRRTDLPPEGREIHTSREIPPDVNPLISQEIRSIGQEKRHQKLKPGQIRRNATTSADLDAFLLSREKERDKRKLPG